MTRIRGIKLLEERDGEGRPSEKGDRVVYNTRLFLNKGDEVPLNARQAPHLPLEMIRVVKGVAFVDHSTVLGSRQAIAGVEHALTGMKVGGYRKVHISPHLAYREKGMPDLIPPDAVLICEIWLRHIVPGPEKRAE
jgi:FKBP-type peptidyl-prolyl cis-trans isomerase (trigger factor)